jgi:hypothetical protein
VAFQCTTLPLYAKFIGSVRMKPFCSAILITGATGTVGSEVVKHLLLSAKAGGRRGGGEKNVIVISIGSYLAYFFEFS